MIAEWEDEDLSNSLQEETSLLDQTLIHILHISDTQRTQKIKEKSTSEQ